MWRFTGFCMPLHVPIYLPAYGPLLKPIEKYFSKWNGLVRQANSRSADELFSPFETCSSLITSNDCFGFYRHVESNLPDCIQSLSLVEDIDPSQMKFYHIFLGMDDMLSHNEEFT
ncbi:hypothetical protein RF11_14669 [Thelohanellus kitauei]|uniref:Tc1-like transposase DDE domain-containing protein n=1 Tax=Thelohanellus kitauei TaxID=669202 RepID=A0A0C2MQV3_THEKT|nr:hypothetical protein RF11_14669 [Thelohanellus kitauei]